MGTLIFRITLTTKITFNCSWLWLCICRTIGKAVWTLLALEPRVSISENSELRIFSLFTCVIFGNIISHQSCSLTAIAENNRSYLWINPIWKSLETIRTLVFCITWFLVAIFYTFSKSKSFPHIRSRTLGRQQIRFFDLRGLGRLFYNLLRISVAPEVFIVNNDGSKQWEITLLDPVSFFDEEGDQEEGSDWLPRHSFKCNCSSISSSLDELSTIFTINDSAGRRGIRRIFKVPITFLDSDDLPVSQQFWYGPIGLRSLTDY